MNQAVSGDEPVAIDNLIVHAEIAASMAHQFIEFFECTFIQQKIHPLASGQLSFFVLPFTAFRPATRLGGCVTAAKLFESRIDHQETV